MARAAVDPIAALLAGAEKKYNLRVGSMEDVADGVVGFSSGNLAIDYAIGVGGLPFGRSIELYGPPSCGKTTMAIQAAATIQKLIISGGGVFQSVSPLTGIVSEIKVAADDYILYMDYEQAMDKKYANALGLDTKHKSLLFTQPDTLEDGVNFAIEAVKTGKVRLVIFDSVAAMNPSAKAAAEIGKSLPAVQAKLMKDFSLNFNAVLYHNNSSAIFLNHLMEKMDMGGSRRPGMPAATTTPGGTALKFFSSVRIEFKQIRQNKGPMQDPVSGETVEIPVSTDVRVKVTKNKVAPPFREAVVRVRFGKGFDNLWTALQVLMSNKKIMHQSGMFYFHNLEAAGLAPEWMARAKTGTNRAYIKGEGTIFKRADQYPEWRDGLIAAAVAVVEENINALDAVAPLRPGVEDEEEDQEEDQLDTMFVSTSAGTRV